MDRLVMHWTNVKNYERVGGCPARHRKVKGYTISSSKARTLASLASCAAVIFTTRVNSIMDCSVASEPWGPKARINGLWLVGTKVVERAPAPHAFFATYREVATLAALSLPPACKRWRITYRRRCGRGCEGFTERHNPESVSRLPASPLFF